MHVIRVLDSRANKRVQIRRLNSRRWLLDTKLEMELIDKQLSEDE